MKGIAHFLTGIALATCFPEVVALARQGSLLPVLGGIGAALPDLLDFRFLRYFERFDLEIDPGTLPNRAAAERAADALARVMGEAFEGAPRRVIAHTVRLGVDCWRRYTLAFDPGAGTLSVRMAPEVTTGGAEMPRAERQGPAERQQPAERKKPDAQGDGVAVRTLGFRLADTAIRQYDVDIFTGPSFTFRRVGDRLAVDFLDWHHRWTHSLSLAVVIGVGLGSVVTLGWGSGVGGWASLVATMGAAAHVLQDQLGYMGCNLLWPLTRERRPGLGLLHAGDPLPNFLVVWTSLALILFNLDRFGGPGVLLTAPYLLSVIGLPWLLLGGAHVARRRRDVESEATAADEGDAERLAEAEAHAGSGMV